MKKRRQKVAGEFNRDSFYKRDSHLEICKARGLGSVGRASRLHREGQRFESASLQFLNEGNNQKPRHIYPVAIQKMVNYK